VSLYTSEGFSDTTQLGEHIAALYDGTKIRCPVVDRAGNPVPKDVLRERLNHEYVHVLVRHMTKDNVPWWFNEGLAETLSSSVTDGEIETVRTALQDKTIFTLDNLTPTNLLNTLTADELALAYAQSHITVDFLYRKYGPRRVKDMLTALGNGTTGEDALREIYRVSYTILQSNTRTIVNGR
jgi:hypothetical protein